MSDESKQSGPTDGRLSFGGDDSDVPSAPPSAADGGPEEEAPAKIEHDMFEKAAGDASGVTFTPDTEDPERDVESELDIDAAVDVSNDAEAVEDSADGVEDVEVEAEPPEEEIALGEEDIIEEKIIVAEKKLAAPKRESSGPARRSANVERSGGGGGWVGAVFEFIGVGLAVGAISIIGAASFAAWYLNQLNQGLPDYQVLSEYAPPVTTRVYAGDGSLVAEFARERRLFVPIEAIPDHVKFAFVSAEDKSFYEHTGLDVRGIVRAQVSNIGNILAGRRLEGGSTITQQVAKNFLLSSEQKVERKLREMLIARKMERTFTKGHILELYLNEIYLGNRSYGVAAAALNYFDKSLTDLTIAEASYLAAITKGPSNYHPIINKDRAIERRNWVIGRLLDDGRISQEEADEARAQPLGAQIAPPLGARDWTMEYFAEEVRKQIVDLYGVEALYDGGLSVRTTVNPRLQKDAGEALRHWLVTYDQRHGWRGPLGVMEIPSEDADVIEAVDDTGDAGDDEEIGPAWARALKGALDPLRETRIVSDDLTPWRPAVVLEVDDNSAAVGFEDASTGTIPLDQLVWAREYISANDRGDEVTSVAQVLNQGDIVYVEQAYELPVEGEEHAAELAIIEGSYALRQAPAVNGGLIAIDPHTGRVLAMVGGFSFRMSEFNRAIQAERQPGSTFKPFVYSVALDNGYTPSSTVLDAPFVAPSLDGWYKPGSYIEGRYAGLSTLRHGIEKSRNTMTARLAQDLGIGRIMDYIERFHLSDHLPRELAISLGSGETTLMRITAAYSIFVNGGKRVEPVLIDRIQDRTGKTVYKRDIRKCLACNAPFWSGQSEPRLVDAREQAMDPRTAFQMVSILEGVVRRGTGSAVRRVSNRPLAGKTGTTNDYKDAWFVGFSPDLAAGVYVGFDMPQTLGRGEAGGKVAAPIFAEFMVEALKDEPAIPFRVPSGIRLVRVNAKTGRPAVAGDTNVILEAFKTDDIIGGGPTRDDLYLDPLSAAPTADEENLDGLY
jgi:penicillin-binding protein 1A